MLISLSELLSQSFEKYSKHFGKTFPYLAVLLSAFLLRYGAGYFGVYLAFNTRLSDYASDFIVLILLIILLILGFWGTIAFMKVSQNLDDNQPLLSFKQQFLTVKKYLLPIFFITLISISLIALGGILLFIPGVIFFVWYYFSSYIALFENKNNLGTLLDSKNLAVGRWWPMAWRITVPKIVFSILSGIIAKAILTIFIIVFNPSPIAYDLAFEFVAGIIAIFMFPLFLWQDITLYHSAKQSPVSPLITQ